MEKVITRPVIDLAATGTNIKNLRIKSGYSVHDLQIIFNFSYPQAVYNWQDGKSVPSIDNLLVLSNLFKVSIEDIIITKDVEIFLDENIQISA